MIKITPKSKEVKEIFCDCCGSRLAIIERKLFSTKYISTVYKQEKIYDYSYIDKGSKKNVIHVCQWCNEGIFSRVNKAREKSKNEH